MASFVKDFGSKSVDFSSRFIVNARHNGGRVRQTNSVIETIQKLLFIIFVLAGDVR